MNDARSKLNRYIGCYESYAESHEALDHNHGMQEEVQNVAKVVAAAVVEFRGNRLSIPEKNLQQP